MKIKLWFMSIVGVVAMAGMTMWYSSARSTISYNYLDLVKNEKQLSSLFPSTAHELTTLKDRYKQELVQGIQAIEAISDKQRTFDNTIQALDRVSGLADAAIFSNICGVLEMVSTDQALRAAAHEAQKEMHDAWIDAFSSNKNLYALCKKFYEAHKDDLELTPEQKRYMAELIHDFERAGLNLPDEQLKQVVALKKELTDLSLAFEKNIADDNRTISVSISGLAGLDADFIDALKRSDDGQYQLGIDYPTYYNVITHSTVESTRQAIYNAALQRGYPHNAAVLKTIIQKRDALAKLLGFTSYAAYDLADQMAQDVSRIDQFLHELMTRSQEKEQAEFAELTAQLPESVSLTPDGKIKPWDLFYLKSAYKKRKHQIDDREIAQYFPVDKTIDRLLAIYRTLFSLDFQQVPCMVWHDDVRLIKVTTADHLQTLGYLFLDLFPRDNKYNHACHAGIIPGIKHDQKNRSATVSTVIANFPKSTADKPALLTFKDAETFFHEFGHALHAVLGATQMAGFSGTSVKRDFVELPSQMLEEWLGDKEILKQVSCHYETGNPLPDNLIESMLAVKRFDSGNFVQTQAFYARLSLDLFNQGADVDPYLIMKNLYVKHRAALHFHEDNHFYASFGHLIGYGAKYYGYLWSKVFAHDLFEEFKRKGLLNPTVGTLYVEKVIGQGGSKDPNDLLQDFLGRGPQQDAFLRDLGL